ncbi:MAG: GDP-mannose 4,6-dehydratase [Candidatus Dormibacteria bacterium]
MRILITGITGFAGSHLAELGLERGAEVFGLVRVRSRMEHIDPIRDRLTLIEGDLSDQASLVGALRESRPDWIFHLAAQSFVPSSWRAPVHTMEVNMVGQVNLLEAVRTVGITPRIHIASSSEEYGLVHPDETPITEQNQLRPLSPYAVSKVGQEMLALQYWHSYQIPCFITRGFNHTGPRRGEMFVTSNFARQVAEIEAGMREPVIRVGNLEARRDWTDVRDMVRAYWLGLEKAPPGEVYNVCSGKAWRVQEMLDMLVEMATVSVRVETDPARLRPSDVELLLGDCSKFQAATGWKPEIPFETTLRDLLDYWRARLAAGKTGVAV